MFLGSECNVKWSNCKVWHKNNQAQKHADNVGDFDAASIMFRWNLEGFIGSFGFHIWDFLFIMFPFIGVLSSKGKEMIKIVFPGLEEFLDLFEFGDGLPDFPDVHVRQ